MESVIERNVMVNSINESGSFKRVDSDTKPQVLNQKPHDAVANEASDVNLSDASKQIATLMEMIEKTPDINHARIKFLQEQLQSGSYQILSYNIAQRMLADIQVA